MSMFKPKLFKNLNINITKGWKHSLYEYLKNPNAELTLRYEDDVILIRDKYPKAKHHYLVLPNKKIPDITWLGELDIPLLKRMGEVADEQIKKVQEEEGKEIQFKKGFHAIPSLEPLHLHVICNNWTERCLKNRSKYNTFNTDFFIPLDKVISTLETEGKIEIDKKKYQSYLKQK